MNEVLSVLGVAGLFLLRIGLPVMLLVGLGILIDRWQSKRDAQVKAQYKSVIEFKRQEAEEAHEERKAA